MDALPRALAHGGLISVIIPIYNEQAVLPQLVQRLLPIMQHVAHPFELILVDDGSTDQSRAMLIQYAQQYASIKAVLCQGQAHAISLAEVRHIPAGDYIAMSPSALAELQKNGIQTIMEGSSRRYVLLKILR
ncbi:glycosyltransferase [uncultured Paenalcaligenes sp.]|uniref:glycosyltransferase n=1 Tax=uncultured Paenalcaligenes sp. TaxID=1588925 RepID=UPI002610897F|nr:glycosyltransferase [uncultured Paenalcaligenes sp.]